MPEFRRSDLQNEIERIESKIEDLGLLTDLGAKSGRVAHIGCASGSQTFALAWVLDPEEIVGLDLDTASAEEYLEEMRSLISESSEALRFGRVSQDDRLWWNTQIPGFIQENRLPTYLEGDITAQTDLRANSYDIVFCDHVLYHIYSDQGEDGVKSALKEMKRIVKKGGWIVAIEPNRSSHEESTHLDFTSIFDSLDLEPYSITNNGVITTYIYKKA